MKDILILGAVAIAGLWWWRQRREVMEAGPASVTVRGAKVSIENVEAIEETRVWKYIGPSAWIVPDAGGIFQLRPGSMKLTPGTYYDAQPALPGKWGIKPSTILLEERTDRQPTIYGPALGNLDVEADTWASYWQPVVLTVGEQLAVGLVVTVPEGMR